MTHIYTDAGSRGNPGKSACAFILVKDNAIIHQESKYLGIKTNNEAEYNAIILALEYLSTTKEKEIQLTSDSEIVIRQITGKYKVTKPHLQRLYDKVQSLIKENNLAIIFNHSKRENNFISRADALVNEELDRH